MEYLLASLKKARNCRLRKCAGPSIQANPPKARVAAGLRKVRTRTTPKTENTRSAAEPEKRARAIARQARHRHQAGARAKVQRVVKTAWRRKNPGRRQRPWRQTARMVRTSCSLTLRTSNGRVTRRQDGCGPGNLFISVGCAGEEALTARDPSSAAASSRSNRAAGRTAVVQRRQKNRFAWSPRKKKQNCGNYRAGIGRSREEAPKAYAAAREQRISR